MSVKKLLYVINVDWYFNLHWYERCIASKKAGYEVHVAFQATDESVTERLRSDGISVHHIRLARKSINPASGFVSLLDIFRVVRIVKPDIVHSVTIKPNIYCGFIARCLGIPQVVSVTGLGLLFSSRSLHIRIMCVCVTSLLKSAFSGRKKIFFLYENNGDKTKIQSLNIGPLGEHVVVPGAGVDRAKFPFCPHTNNAAGMNVLFAARLLEDKGLFLLVNAIDSLVSDGMNITLTIAGIYDPDSANAISEEQLAIWKSKHFVNFLGQVSPIQPVISSADIVCLPTMYGEGVPRILIEAAAMGRALITSDLDGCKDICIDGYNGFLVPAGCVDSVKNVLSLLYQDRDLLQAMGKNGSNHALKNFDQKFVIEKTIASYNSLVHVCKS